MGRSGYGLDPLSTVGIGYDPKLKAKSDYNITEWIYFQHLYLLAISRFKYNNLPDTISVRMLEQSYVMRGNVLVFENPVIGLIGLPSVNTAPWNIYMIPSVRYVNMPNGYHTIRYAHNSVLGYNDDTCCSFVPTIQFYARKLAKLETAKDTNIALQMKPKIIRTNKDNENSVRQMLNNTQLGLPYVLLQEDSLIGDSKTEVLDLGTDMICDDLDRAKAAILGEYLSRLGYNNNPARDKKENLVVDEVNSNNENIIGFRLNCLYNRQILWEQVNKMFGTNVSVEYNAVGPLLRTQFDQEIVDKIDIEEPPK